MFVEHTVLIKGKAYSLDLEFSPGDSTHCRWQWSDDDNILPPATLKRQLDRKFIESWTEETVAKATKNEARCLKQLLPAMGVSDKHLKDIGLLEWSEQERLRHVRERTYSTLPAPCHSPLNSLSLLQWFREEQTTSIPGAVLIGDGPFDASQFESLLLEMGLFAALDEYALDQLIDSEVDDGQQEPDSIVYVLGRNNWSGTDLDVVIDMHEGRELKFYSQEMFAALLLTGKDAFSGGEEILYPFSVGHPALQYISEGWPGWVSTKVMRKNDGSGEVQISQQDGLLKYFGYRTGQSGESEFQRQKVLEEVFQADLERLRHISDESYLKEWGLPNSPARLNKMAQCIAAFCCNQKRRARPAETAIEHWEADLEWLRQKFYTGHMRFSWPQTNVW